MPTDLMSQPAARSARCGTAGRGLLGLPRPRQCPPRSRADCARSTTTCSGTSASPGPISATSRARASAAPPHSGAATSPDPSAEEEFHVTCHHRHHRRRAVRPGHEPRAQPALRDHLVLERGRIGNSWHAERWDSLRLLTPNWMSAPAGPQLSAGPHPDGFMSCADFAASLERAAALDGAPVRPETTVLSLERLRRRLPRRD